MVGEYEPWSSALRVADKAIRLGIRRNHVHLDRTVHNTHIALRSLPSTCFVDCLSDVNKGRVYNCSLSSRKFKDNERFRGMSAYAGCAGLHCLDTLR